MSPPVIGIDLGGTNMQIGVVDNCCAIIGRTKKKTLATEGAEGVIGRIIEGAREACDAAGIRLEDAAALGIAAPGAIDMPRGVVIEAPNLGWNDYPLRDVLAKKLGIPIIVDNDVNGAIWGERTLGAGRGHDNLLGVWVGTGVGGGLVIGGKVYHGPKFTAGEVGQTVVDPFAPAGQRTVEENCSRTGISMYVRRKLQESSSYAASPLCHVERAGETAKASDIIPSKHLAQAFRDGDELAVEVVQRAGFLLGVAVANWVTVLSLARVVIGGGVTESLGQPFLDLIRQSFMEHVFPKSLRECQLAMTELADDSGLLGAALLAREAAQRA